MASSSYAVLVDFGHMFYRCYSIALQAPAQHNLIDTTVYHFRGVLRTLDKELAKRKIHEYDVIFAEDRQAKRKLDLLPSYRAGRTDRHHDKENVKSLLKDAGVSGHWCYSEGNEADDVIATLVRMSGNQQGLFTIIVSGDKDLWQLMGPTTAVFHPTKKEFVTQSDIGDSFQSAKGGKLESPIHIPLFKALWGDAGDCVPNAYPRTQRYLMDLVRRSPTGHLDEFKQFVKERWTTLSPRCREIITAGEGQVDVNWQLVKLDDQCQLKWG